MAMLVNAKNLSTPNRAFIGLKKTLTPYEIQRIGEYNYPDMTYSAFDGRVPLFFLMPVVIVALIEIAAAKLILSAKKESYNRLLNINTANMQHNTQVLTRNLDIQNVIYFITDEFINVAFDVKKMILKRIGEELDKQMKFVKKLFQIKKKVEKGIISKEKLSSILQSCLDNDLTKGMFDLIYSQQRKGKKYGSGQFEY